MKKVITIILVIIMIITILFVTKTKAVEDNTNPYIYIKKDMSNYEENNIIELTINFKNVTDKVSYIDFYIDYDKNIFEEIKTSDFSNDLDENVLSYFDYSTEANKISIEFDDDVEISEVCKIKLKVLDGVSKDINTDFKVEHATYYSFENDKTFRFDDKTKTLNSNQEEDIYLSSEIYKIGNNDINNYEDGDEYISKIKANTTLKDYINNLSTNGEIKVIKEDETELTEDELVGTGMILRVTKDEEEIELKIAVEGDLSGDGKVTATDLSTINQTILKLVTLENEYKIAGDLDENDNITATDLSTINQIILKLL